MAITINTEIAGQVASSTCSYCYLYEPLRISVTEDDSEAQYLHIDLEIIDTADVTNVIETKISYGVYDIIAGVPISIDLMKLVRQYHDADVYKYSNVDDITDATTGWQSVVSKYKYNFLINSNTDRSANISCFKLPIIGRREFKDFASTPAVGQTIDLTEAEVESVSLDERWINYPFIETSLQSASADDSTPTITNTAPTIGCNPHGGFLVYKSKLGGWMTWGFKMRKENTTKKYIGNIEVGMFETTDISGGDPYIPVDYAGIEIGYSVNLKQLALTSAELRAVHGIISSPAVYYMRSANGVLELMRLTSAQAPIDSKANGGDFTVNLKSISNAPQSTR